MSSFNIQNIPVSSPSICVPYVVDKVDKITIHKTFKSLFGEGNIERIDVVFREKENGEKYKRVFVHFKQWPDTHEAQEARYRLLSGQEFKIVYDEPWFWKCRASYANKPEANKPTSIICNDEDSHKIVHDNHHMILSELIPRQVLFKSKLIKK